MTATSASEIGDVVANDSWLRQPEADKLRVVSALLSHGLNGKEIAAALGVSTATVSNYRKKLRDRYVAAQGSAGGA